MKKIICCLCVIACFLYGCAGTNNGVCNNCSSAEKDKKIQELTEQYPVDSWVVKNSSIFTVKEHVNRMDKPFNTVYGVILERSGIKEFIPYNVLLSDYKQIPTEAEMLQVAEETEKELLASNDIIDVLDFYYTHFHLIEDEVTGQKFLSMQNCYLDYECEQEMYVVMQTMKDLSVNKKCLISMYHEKNSDECILARRKTPDAKNGWFDYKKYLPANSAIKTEQQFFDLYTMYKAIWRGAVLDPSGWEYDWFVEKWAARKCYKNKEQTQEEKDKCVEEEREFIENIAFGKAQKCSVKYSTLYGKFKQDLKNTTYLYQEKEKGDTEQYTKFGAINLCLPDKIGL